MEIEYTPILVGVGLGTASVLAWKLKKTKPVLEFNDAVFERDTRRLRLTVSNLGKRGLFTKPLLRKIVQSEGCVQTDSGSRIPFLPAARDASRTMYELVSECNDPIEIPSSSSIELIFHLDHDPGFKLADYLYVESPCGKNRKNMGSSVVKTIPIFAIDGEVDVKTVDFNESGDIEDLFLAEPPRVEELTLEDLAIEPSCDVSEPLANTPSCLTEPAAIEDTLGGKNEANVLEAKCGGGSMKKSAAKPKKPAKKKQSKTTAVQASVVGAKTNAKKPVPKKAVKKKASKKAVKKSKKK